MIYYSIFLVLTIALGNGGHNAYHMMTVWVALPWPISKPHLQATLFFYNNLNFDALPHTVFTVYAVEVKYKY